MPPDTDWHHFFIEFTDPSAAEHTTAHEVAPVLDQAQHVGELQIWWYLRKTPAWRLRYQPTNPDTTVLDTLLINLAASGHVASWTQGIYEPETLAFGGHAAMDIAHTLFHQDSQHLLARAAQTEPSPALGRRETTVLLYSSMLRAAGLDWFEQGDVWAKVTTLRPASHPHPATPGRADGLSRAIRRLMTPTPAVFPTSFLSRGWPPSTRPGSNSPRSPARESWSEGSARSWRTTSSSTPTAPASRAPIKPPWRRWPSTPCSMPLRTDRYKPAPLPTPLRFRNDNHCQ